MSDFEGDSVPETKQGFTVTASPLNSVKLELGIILIIGFFLLFIVSAVVESNLLQIGLLGAYGLSAMIWLIHRVRKIMAELN